MLAGCGFSPIAKAQTEASCVTGWLQAQTNVQTWAAAFKQTRTFKALKDPLTAKGRVWFAAPNRFRWELGEPAQTIAIRAENELVIIYPRLKRVERFPLGQAGAWRDTLALLEAGFPRTEAGLRERYHIKSEKVVGEACEIVLEPKSPQARNLVRQISVTLDPGKYQLLGTAIVFADGSVMNNEFSQGQLNPQVPPEIFTPEIPSDYRVVEPLRK